MNERVPIRTLVLEPGRADRHYWRDIWAYRELLAILAWRDIVVRYKQTVIGIGWAVLRPLITILVFSVIFGRLAKLPTEGAGSYPILVFAGMLPWFLFSTILNDASASLVSNANLVSKVYFPRILIPLAVVAVALVDFLINLVLMLLFVLVSGDMISWRIVFLPAFIALTIVASLGPALLMAALNVTYRDFRYIIPFVVQFGLYVSPVGFSSKVVPEHWAWLFALNPIVGIIDGFRWCLIQGNDSLRLSSVGSSLAVSALLLYAGIRYFRRTERAFADVI